MNLYEIITNEKFIDAKQKMKESIISILATNDEKWCQRMEIGYFLLSKIIEKEPKTIDDAINIIEALEKEYKKINKLNKKENENEH